MALPDFGLMTKADKLKLDAIDTTTLLTKTEAATTYATKAEMREYIKQVVESDTGFVFINGNDSEVGLIPALIQKESPNLTVTMNGETVGDTFEIQMLAGYSSTYFDVSRNGSGVITVTDTQDWMGFDSSSNQIIQSYRGSRFIGDSTTVTVNLASDGTYDSATKVFTVTYTEPEMPEPVDEPVAP